VESHITQRVVIVMQIVMVGECAVRCKSKGFCSGELYKKEIVKSVAANFEFGFPCFSSLWLNRALLHLHFLGEGGVPILTFDIKLFYLFFLPPLFLFLHSFLTSFCFCVMFLCVCLFLIIAGFISSN